MLCALAGVLGSTVGGRVGAALSPESDKRKRLIERLELDKTPKKKPGEGTTPSEDPPTPDEPDTAPNDEPPSDGTSVPGSKPQGKAGARRVTYTGRVHRMLQSGCASCHRAGASAGGTRFVLSGDVGRDYRAARKLVSPGKPDRSPLLTKAAGKAHGGGANFPAGSSKYKTLRAWIAAGAPRGGAKKKAAPAPTVVVPPRTSGTARKSSKAPAKRKAPAPSAPPAPTAGSPAAAQAPLAFAPTVHRVLLDMCMPCHNSEASGPAASFVLTGDTATDYETSVRRVNHGTPTASILLTKALGTQHAGGATLHVGSREYGDILRWIEDGAVGPEAPDPTAPVAVDAKTGASPRTEPAGRLGDGTPLGPQTSAPSRLPFALPFHLRLNGKFDFSYERRQYKDHPFGDGSNAYQTYHHFLFLSRAGADDPFGFNIELITQAFYEFNARIAPRGRKFDFVFKGGKILVPFGPEPLFHKSYGGRSGFDQEILPLIWAEPGLAVTAHVRAGPVSFSNDFYTVQGHSLASEDATLNLQSDISNVDEFRAAFGDRVGVSWGPLSGWYSFHFNRLGFDRLLYLQAVDLEFWRLRDVPFLKNVVLGIGGMRADVSGAGAGRDYYHFGSYGMVGYYPVKFLYLQYRGGLRTTDNRKGLFYDARRADERDRSSHNITIVARYKGFYGGVQMFWNLEKANEQDDDFLRLTVGYEF